METITNATCSVPKAALSTGDTSAVVTHRTAHWNSPMRLSHVRDSSAPQVASVSTPSFRMRAFRGVFLPACKHATAVG